jgi:hypothetical protein
MTCPGCGTINESGRKYRGECGAKLAAVCPSCGMANPPSARFCGECGSPMGVVAAVVPPAATAPILASVPAAGPAVPSGTSSARLAPVAERRLVSILFGDLVEPSRRR